MEQARRTSTVSGDGRSEQETGHRIVTARIRRNRIVLVS